MPDHLRYGIVAHRRRILREGWKFVLVGEAMRRVLVLLVGFAAGSSCGAPAESPQIPELSRPERVATPKVPLPGLSDFNDYLVRRFPSDAAATNVFYLEAASAALNHHVIFSASAGWGILEMPVLPDGGSWGVFASGPDSVIHYLLGPSHERREALTHILRSEQINLGSSDPAQMASLFALTLLTDGDVNVTRSLILNRGALRDRAGYEIAWREVLPHWFRIRGPEWTESRGGWVLQFYTLGGWMHVQTELAVHRVVVTADYNISIESQVLTESVYSRVPDIEY